jgi:hypothetical protein
MDLQGILTRIEGLEKDVTSLKKRLPDAVLDAEDEEAISDYTREKAAGKLVLNDQLKEELDS